MWCAMALAMMLPTAGPMIYTYAELAGTAARKGEAAVSPLVLAAGYIAVWFGAALGLASLQFAFSRLALLDPAMAPASPLFSGALFVAAGLYQFSPLKHACVTQCQHPLRFFFANWTAEPARVFVLGLRQGLYCLGCCWAMMLLMFAVGVMNVIWMVLLGTTMTIEKIGVTTRFSRALGVMFVLVGVVLIASVVAVQWPSAG
jgi:predicted metal-binding membrane protein